MRIFILLILALFASVSHAADYTVPTTTNVVDGSTYCNSAACTSADTIIIAAGDRSRLLLQNFDGNGSYIVIKNEDSASDTAVRIVNGSSGSGRVHINFNDCSYIDFRGDGDPDITYGFFINHGSENLTQTVQVYGQSDHIKISYVDITFTGNTSANSAGFKIQDSDESNTWTYDTIEIHHNRVNGANYCGMYLGHNDPLTNDNPYVANISMHDNIILNSARYGFILKGMLGPENSEVYNNTIGYSGFGHTYHDPTDSDIADRLKGGAIEQGRGAFVVDFHDNFIYDTWSCCLRTGDNFSSTGQTNVYDNVFAGCAQADSGAIQDKYLTAYYGAYQAYTDFDDNYIIQPGKYGLTIAGNSGSTVSVERNSITEATTNIYTITPATPTIGTGADANTYYADTDSVGFVTWSDDSDYTNDNFAISTCSDGIQGGDETGVDCGGSCDPCSSSASIRIGRARIGGTFINLTTD